MTVITREELEASDGATIIGYIQPATGADARTVADKLADLVSVKDFGALGDGVTDDSAAFNDCFDSIGDEGGTVIIPAGQYMFESQVTIDWTDKLGNLVVLGYGAELFTDGGISALQIVGHSTPHGVTLMGLKVNHRGNGEATAGFELVSTDHCVLRDCTVEVHGTQAGYAAYWLRNGTASDPDTGCFWSLLDNCKVRKRSGGDSGTADRGILLEGAANATTIRGGSLSTVDTGIEIKPHTSQAYIANGVLIDGVAFETITTAVHVNAASSAAISGLRIVNSRLEALTTFLSLTGSTVAPAVATFLAGNFGTPDIVTYCNNPQSLFVESYDRWLNPAITIERTHRNATATRFVATSGSEHGLIVCPGGGARGLRVEDASGNAVANLTWTGAGTKSRIGGASTAELAVSAVQGLSGTTTDANNLRGSVTLSSGSAAVSFATAEPDTSYFLTLGGNANETFCWTSKTTGGFTINSSNGSSTAVVNWHLIR